MNSLRLLRPQKVNQHLKTVGRYGTPRNRWQWHYMNEDGIFEEDFNWIELKNMPQPFPKNDFIYSHKWTPKENFPQHSHDFRYNYYLNRLPRRHFAPDFLFKQYNFNDIDAMMHGIQWSDFDLDHQLADPMESNHYINGRSPSFVIFMFCGLVLLTFIYPLYGYGVLDAIEDPYRLRKVFQFPDASLVFTWLASFPGHSHGMQYENGDGRLGARMDKDGNILPNAIRKYYFEDEYAYRV